MNNICFCIPARYNSSRLKCKLLLDLNGESCIRKTIKQVLKSKYFNNNLYLLTDNVIIKNEVLDLDCKIILTEQEYKNGSERISKNLDKVDSTRNIIVNIQADEPYISEKNIDYCIKKHLDNNNEKLFYSTLHEENNTTDYLMSTASLKLLTDSKNNVLYYSRNIVPWNKKGEVVEGYTYKTFTGIYVYNRAMLQKYGDMKDTPLQTMEDCEQLKIIENGYQIKSYSTVNYNEISLNTEEDYNYMLQKYCNKNVESIKISTEKDKVNENNVEIKLVIFDFDGVFTDGKIIFDSQGNAMKHYNAEDGMGIFRLQDSGYEIGVISGWHDNVSQRSVLKHLKIERVSLGSNSKLEILNKWCEELGITLDNVAYIGDDLNDIKAMKEVKLVACPNNAVREVKDIADFICKKNGGEGAVREFCEYLITSNLKTEIKTTKIIPILDDIESEFNYQINNYPIINIENLAKLIEQISGNIHICGVGKSGTIAKHCCDLLKSVSVQAFTFDILNSVHGNIGALKKNDAIIIFSNSGNTSEIIELFPLFKKINLKIIGITCKKISLFNEYCDIIINIPCKNEICGNIDKIPTNSAMSQIIFCNILVSFLKKKISLEEYRDNHNSGDIGKSLLKIKDVLITKYAYIYFNNEVRLHDVFIEMIEKKMGCCFFLKPNNELIGILTDGDIRRLIVNNKNLNIITNKMINNCFYYEENCNKYMFECKNNYPYIPVLKNKKLIGYISNICS